VSIKSAVSGSKTPDNINWSYYFYPCFWRISPPPLFPSHCHFHWHHLPLYTITIRRSAYNSFAVHNATILCKHSMATLLTLAVLSLPQLVMGGGKISHSCDNKRNSVTLTMDFLFISHVV